MNLKVPKETLGGCLEEPRTRSLKGAGLPPIRHGKTLCPKTAKRTKSPKKGGGDEVSSSENGFCFLWPRILYDIDCCKCMDNVPGNCYFVMS